MDGLFGFSHDVQAEKAEILLWFVKKGKVVPVLNELSTTQ
jgi:hypothetical protein